MSTFTVRWEEDIEADSPADAVQKAQAILAGPPGLVFFTVVTERGDELEMDTATGELRYTVQIPEHRHDFVGDEDTCVVYQGCPVTWAQHLRRTREKHVHKHERLASWSTGPDGETDSLRACVCGEQITTEETTP